MYRKWQRSPEGGAEAFVSAGKQPQRNESSHWGSAPALLSQARLPTRLPKLVGNNHAKHWLDDRPCVELDAIPPQEMRALAGHCIEQHIDLGRLDPLRAIEEEEERKQLRIFGDQIANRVRP